MTSWLRFSLLLIPVLGLALLVTWLPRIAERQRDPAPPEQRVMPIVLDESELALQAELKRLGEGFSGEVGLAVQDISTGQIIHYEGDSLYPQQSVSKLWVAMTALDLADEGDLDLSEPVTIGRKDLTVFFQPIRRIVRNRGSFSTDYADLLERALTQSDNTANDRILRRVGGVEAVEDFLDDNDLDGIRFGADERTKQSLIAGLEWRQEFSYRNRFYEARNEVPDGVRKAAFENYLADPVDGASPIAVVHALGQLVRGELLSSVSTELLLATLSQTRSGPRRLKGGLPSGWTIAHKTGTGQVYGPEQSGYNDIGIVTSPSGREYSVAAMIRRTSEPVLTRMQMMQEVVRAVARYDEAAYPPTPADPEVAADEAPAPVE